MISKVTNGLPSLLKKMKNKGGEVEPFNLVESIKFYASIMGAVLALVFQKYRNMTAPVLMHGAANVAVYFVTYFF